MKLRLLTLLVPGLLLGTLSGAAGMADMPGMHHSAEPSGVAGSTLNPLRTLSGRAFDVAFLQAMTAHHQMAVEMANFEVTWGRDAATRAAARALMATQQKEIATMRARLESWQAAATVSSLTITSPKVGAVDRWFLSQMLPHHQGALDLAELALKRSQDAQIKALARQIIAVQHREMEEYQSRLRELK